MSNAAAIIPPIRPIFEECVGEGHGDPAFMVDEGSVLVGGMVAVSLDGPEFEPVPLVDPDAVDGTDALADVDCESDLVGD